MSTKKLANEPENNGIEEPDYEVELNNKLVNVIGGQDLTENFRRIAESMSSIGFRYPAPEDNIFSPGLVCNYPITVGEMTTTYPIDCTDVIVESITAGTSSGCTYKIALEGEVKKINSATSTAIFGSTAYTHCALVAIELPSMDYDNITVALGSGEAKELSEKDAMLMAEDYCCYVLPLGMYDDDGTTVVSYNTYTITQNGFSMKNEFDVSDVTLEE